MVFRGYAGTAINLAVSRVVAQFARLTFIVTSGYATYNPSQNSRPATMDLEKIQQRLREFARERDWEQFHSPKNLSMALSVEVAELVEHFQWLTASQSSSAQAVDREQVATEIADIQIFLIMLADKLGVDIEQSVHAKIEANAVKYPPTVAS